MHYDTPNPLPLFTTVLVILMIAGTRVAAGTGYMW